MARVRARLSRLSMLIAFALLAPAALSTARDARAQTADDRAVQGIYLIVPMNAAVSGSALLAKSLANPDVTGVYIRTTWKRLEPIRGQFDWSYLDQQIAAAAALGKKVAFGVDAGRAAPDWLYAEGAQRFDTVVTIPRQPDFCEPMSIPIPWDGSFLAAQRRFIAAMGARYAKDPNVVIVKMTGIGYRTDEVLLPRENPRRVRGEAVAGYRECAYPDDVSNWRAAGYSTAKLNDAFRSIVMAYKAAFPRQKLAMMTGINAFPPLGERGELDSTARNLPESSFFGIAYELLGPRFVAQVNNLRADQVDPGLLQWRGRTGLAFQAAWPVTGDQNCRMQGGRKPCEPVSTFQQAMRNAVDANALFVELFKEDIANPEFSAILSETAHGLGH